MTAAYIIAAVALVLGLGWAATEATVWWQARNDSEDATYGALRSPGMGDLRSVPDEDDAA